MGRDIDAIKITGEDRRKYRDKVRRSLDVFARMLREHRFEGDPAQVGVEIELNLVDGQGDLDRRLYQHARGVSCNPHVAQDANSQIEAVGRELRGLMSWVKKSDVVEATESGK